MNMNSEGAAALVPQGTVTAFPTMLPDLLFSVEASGVAVGDVDVAVRLDDGQPQASQDAVEQLAARRLRETQGGVATGAQAYQRDASWRRVTRGDKRGK